MSHLTDEWENILDFIVMSPSQSRISKSVYQKYKLRKKEIRRGFLSEYPNWRQDPNKYIIPYILAVKKQWDYMVFASMELKEEVFYIKCMKLLHINQMYDHASIIYKYYSYNNLLDVSNMTIFYSYYNNDGKFTIKQNILDITPSQMIGYTNKHILKDLSDITKTVGTFVDICSSNNVTIGQLHTSIDHYYEYIRYFFDEPKPDDKFTNLIRENPNITFDEATLLSKTHVKHLNSLFNAANYYMYLSNDLINSLIKTKEIEKGNYYPLIILITLIDRDMKSMIDEKALKIYSDKINIIRKYLDK